MRRIFGAVLVVDDEIRGTGYCGSPRGTENCIDKEICVREKMGIPSGERYEYCKSVHAEQNVLISVSRRDAVGGVIYIFGEDMIGENAHFRVEPCLLCKRMIINAGIKTVITKNPACDILRFNVEDWVKEENYMKYEGGKDDN